MSSNLLVLVMTLGLVWQETPVEVPPASTKPAAKRISSAYCGLHCVYAAARMDQADPSIDRIMRPEFINGPYGSSATNLIDAFGE